MRTQQRPRRLLVDLTVSLGLLLGASLGLALAPARAAAQGEGAVRVLFIPDPTVPPRLRRTIVSLLAARTQLVDYGAYTESITQRNLRPSHRRALQRFATQQGADVIIVASYGGHYRRRTLRMRYHRGTDAELVSSASIALIGQHLRAAGQHAILRDLNTASGGRTGEGGATVPDAEPEEGDPEEVEGAVPEGGAPEGEGEGGLPPPLDWEAEEAAAGGGEGEGDAPAAPVEEAGEGGEEEEEGESGPAELPIEEQRQWGFAISAGAGIMNRSSSVPSEAGPATLATLPFPAIQAEVIGYVRPDITSRFRLELDARYTTSVGLVAQDQRADMTTRTTDMRAHHFRLGLTTRIPLAPGERPTVLLLSLGLQFRMLDSEIAVSIPDYTIGGVAARIGLYFTIGDSPISIGIVPEIGHAGNLSAELAEVAQVTDGFIVGAEAEVRVQIIPEVAVTLMYREAHAFLGSPVLMAQLSDAERYGILRAEYRF